MIDLDQRYPIYLEWACGCTESWEISLPPDPDEVTHHSPEACPDPCPSCTAAGRLCQMRESLVRYRPAEFSEIVPVRRAVRRKASA
jgi:hypothetical protein